MCKVGLFTIVKNEHCYLDEWLYYHINLGIDEIYVFDDVGSDSHKEICNKYKNVTHKGILEIYPQVRHNSIIKNKINHTAYLGYQLMFMCDCISYIKNNSDINWLSNIDIDEFITLENEKDSIKEVLNCYLSYEILILQWLNYNANGNIEKPEGGVLDVYNKTCIPYFGKTMDPRASCKMFFNLNICKLDNLDLTIHIPKSTYNYCKTNYSRDLYTLSYNRLYIRHYITKSFREWCEKLYVRGQFQGSKKLSQFFGFNPDIDIRDISVQNIINEYADRVLSGELPLYLF